jgi:4-amino-4-deoxychorismate lyase
MILVDGRLSDSIPAGDRGLQFGDGVFETLAVVGGEPLCMDAHLQRLCAGCRVLDIPAPDTATLRAESRQLARGATRAVLKIIVSRGTGARGYAPPAEPAPLRVVSIHPWPEHPAAFRERGVDAAFCSLMLARQPALAGIKHLNRLEQVLARAEITRRGVPEGIVCDTGGAVIEGTMSNVFIRCGNELRTPGLEAAGVAGIIRSEVLNRAAAIGIDVRICALERRDVLAADEIFFTNSIIGVWPVRKLQERAFQSMDAAARVARSLVDAGCIAPP